MYYVVLALSLLMMLISVMGLVGAGLVAFTREDAFDVANRKSKWVWCAILVGASVATLFYHLFGFMFGIVGSVFIGLYWFDVRPQIKDILDGTGGFY